METLAKEPMEDFVDFIASTHYEDLPAQVIEFEKEDLLNTLGTLIVGMSFEEALWVTELIMEWGGRPQSRIPVGGAAVPAPLAGLLMGTACRAADLGDSHEEAAHVAEFVVPVLLAIADMEKAEGKVISGRDLITAHVVGSEVVGRIGRACFFLTFNLHAAGVGPGFWTFGAAAAAAKLIKLDRDTTWNAMGIASNMLCTTDWQSFIENTSIWRLSHAGFAAQNGITCALLARKGITGPKNVFLGHYGFLHSHFPLKNDPTLLTTDLGRKWDFLTLLLKPYMGCKFTHSPVTAVINIIKQNDIHTEHIAEINCRLHPAGIATVAESKQKWNEVTVASCQFSLPYIVATAASTGNVPIESFTTEEARAKTDVRRLMSKVTVSADETLPTFSAVVTITLTNGRKYTKRVDHVRGSPQNRMSWDETTKLFMDCAAHSPKAIPRANLNQVVEIVKNLENCTDVTEIMTLLIP